MYSFGKILNIWDRKSHHSKVGELKYPHSYSSCAKGFISGNEQETFKRCRAKLLEETCNYPCF